MNQEEQETQNLKGINAMEETSHTTRNDRQAEGLGDRMWPKTERQDSVWVSSKSMLKDVGF